MADFTPPSGKTFIGLDAAAATGDGAICDLGFVAQNFTMQTVTTGSPSSVSVTLQGSIDGAVWNTLATSTSTSGDAQYASAKPYRFLKCNLGTLSGGTAPTVTARVAAGY